MDIFPSTTLGTWRLCDRIHWARESFKRHLNNNHILRGFCFQQIVGERKNVAIVVGVSNMVIRGCWLNFTKFGFGFESKFGFQLATVWKCRFRYLPVQLKFENCFVKHIFYINLDYENYSKHLFECGILKIAKFAHQQQYWPPKKLKISPTKAQYITNTPIERTQPTALLSQNRKLPFRDSVMRHTSFVYTFMAPNRDFFLILFDFAQLYISIYRFFCRVEV